MTELSNDKLSQIEAAVREAGAKLLELWPGRNTGRELQINRKSDGSMVTEADLASNEILTDALQRIAPEDFIFSEEKADSKRFSAANSSWIIDPLDGTEIFSRGLDYFAVFLARKVGTEITAGYMYYPALGNMFVAYKGRGATLNGVPLKVSTHKKLRAQSVYVEAIKLAPAPHLCDPKNHPVGTSAFGALCRGDLDGVVVRFTSSYFYPWDFAPGMLIIKECGGKVTDENGQEIAIRTSPVSCKYMVASNGLLHEAVTKVIPK